MRLVLCSLGALLSGRKPWLCLVLSAVAGFASGPAVAQEPLHVRIDRLIQAGYSGPVAAKSDDAEFLRRVSIDLRGWAPAGEEAQAFVADPRSDKRHAVIEQMIDSPEFARRMTYFFDMMFCERRAPTAVPADAWQEYLYQSVLQRKPLDRLCAEILAADGADPQMRPAARFYLDRGAEVDLLTRDVSRVFLGMDLGCAQCHDHPLISGYLQEDYYGLSAFLNRTFLHTDPATKLQSLAEKAEGEVTYKSVFNPNDTTHTSSPHLPGMTPLEEPKFEAPVAYFISPQNNARAVPRFSRRQLLAQEIVGGRTRDFSRNLANRLWAMMFDRGIVHPVDFRHDANPPSHPELLDLLAEHLVATKYDLHGLVRELALTETYQRSSGWPEEVDPATVPADRFAVAELRALTPEQFAWCLLQAVGHVRYQQDACRAQAVADVRFAEMIEDAQRRQHLQDIAVEGRVHATLRGVEGSFVGLYAGAPGPGAHMTQATVHQALFFSNGSLIRSWVAPGAMLTNKLIAQTDPQAAAETLYWHVLARAPTEEERADVVQTLSQPGIDRAVVVPELVWGLLASAEFRYNH